VSARLVRSIVLLWVAGVLAGCASRTTVVLLPEAHGRDTAVTVTRGDGSVVLDRPYAAVREGVLGLRTFESTPQEVESLFGAALAAQPARAATFTLYFVEGKDVLTDESRQLVDTSLAEIARRPVPDVLVVGHTDLVGSHASNDALSRQRADLIRNELIRLGVAAQNIEVIARGKRDPIVPTADGVAEPRNRRVEVIVR
jgi:outer membrane protein OmpA-like peptidoglycan-associated protein